MTKLIITNKFDAKKILNVEVGTREARPLGMMELFTELAQKGCCESYNTGRIYFMAYLLAENYPGLQFEVKEVE